MQVRSEQLERHLEQPLAPVYLVTGDETLLVQEACQRIIAAATAQGFSDRKVFDLDGAKQWPEVFADAGNMSLFAEKRLLDVRVPVKGFDRSASDALRGYLGSPFDDTVVLIRTGRLDGRQRNAAWFKAIDAAGVALQIWPIGERQLPRWLGARAQAIGVALERDAIELLADRVEGNLLAAVHQLEMLKLADLEGPVSVETLRAAVADASHFDTFELVDAAFDGRARRVRKLVRVLAQEGVPVFMIMGAVTSQLRRVLRVAGGARERLPPQRQKLLENAAARLGVERIEGLLSQCAMLDLQAKGMLRGDAWTSLESLLVEMAGGADAELWPQAAHLTDR